MRETWPRDCRTANSEIQGEIQKRRKRRGIGEWENGLVVEHEAVREDGKKKGNQQRARGDGRSDAEVRSIPGERGSELHH